MRVLWIVVTFVVAASLAAASVSSSWLVARDEPDLRMGPLVVWDCGFSGDWTLYTPDASEASGSNCHHSLIARVLEWDLHSARSFVGLGVVTGGAAMLSAIALVLAVVLRRRAWSWIALVGLIGSVITAILFATHIPPELTPKFALGSAFWMFAVAATGGLASAGCGLRR
jgi:hypothetical protein